MGTQEMQLTSPHLLDHWMEVKQFLVQNKFGVPEGGLGSPYAEVRSLKRRGSQKTNLKPVTPFELVELSVHLWNDSLMEQFILLALDQICNIDRVCSQFFGAFRHIVVAKLSSGFRALWRTTPKQTRSARKTTEICIILLTASKSLTSHAPRKSLYTGDAAILAHLKELNAAQLEGSVCKKTYNRLAGSQNILQVFWHSKPNLLKNFTKKVAGRVTITRLQQVTKNWRVKCKGIYNNVCVHAAGLCQLVVCVLKPG